jgi:hypothetical protein
MMRMHVLNYCVTNFIFVLFSSFHYVVSTEIIYVSHHQTVFPDEKPILDNMLEIYLKY